MFASSAFLCLLALSQSLAAPVTEPAAHEEGGAAPAVPSSKECSSPSKRLPWQALSNEQKKAYIDAELCLMRKPSQLDLPGAVTRFDDLVKPHQIQAHNVHNTGYFLPFHRMLMHAHEQALRNECGYTGHQVYWAEELDIGKIEQSDVLDPETGFGGGVLNQMVCIPDGPFKNYTLHTGPGYENTERCIQRNLNNPSTYQASQKFIDYCYQYDKFEQAWQCLEDGGPHGAFHSGVGGEMLNPISSPGDPVFYLHHTWLDKVWWDWQKQKPERLTDISGRKTSGMFRGGFPGGPGGLNLSGIFGADGLNLTEIFGPGFNISNLPGFGSGGRGRGGQGPPGGFPGLPGNFTPGNFPGGFPGFGGPDAEPSWQPRNTETVTDPVALEDVVTVFGIIPNMTVADLMDIQGGPLCYEYVDYEDAVKLV